MFDEVFLTLRKIYYGEGKKKVLWTSVNLLIMFSAVGIVVDVQFPFTRWINLARSLLIMGPIAFFAFVLGYFWVLYYRDKKLEDEESEFVDYRTKLPPSARRNIGIISIVVIFLAVYASYRTFLTTFIGGLAFAFLVCLIAFLRLTPEEQERAEKGLKDARDKSVEEYVAARRKARQNAAEGRRMKKRKKREEKK